MSSSRYGSNSILSIPVLMLAASLTLVGCRSGESEDSPVAASAISDPQADALESAVTMIAGQADDASGDSFARLDSLESTRGIAKYSSLLLSNAWAAACSRAVAQSCNNADGSKSITYSACSILARGFSISGWVNLDYSNNNCTLGVGENVLRTYDHTITGPRGGTVQTFSAPHPNYLGHQVGGGGRLTHTAASTWEIEILGKNKLGVVRGRTLFDVSAHTTSPIQISGSLSRSGRSVTGGKVEVDHNVKNFTVAYEVDPSKPLVWNSSCCHPVSGTVSATYSGSITGQGSISFTGCGSAQLTKDGSSQNLGLGYCE